jgi:ribosomal protein L24E
MLEPDSSRSHRLSRFEKCWFCDGSMHPHLGIKLEVRLYAPNDKSFKDEIVYFCSENCKNAYRFGLDWVSKEEPNVVY